MNVGDVAQDADYLTALGDTRSEVIVPVLARDPDRVIGTIDVESERLDALVEGANENGKLRIDVGWQRDSRFADVIGALIAYFDARCGKSDP